MFYLDFKKLKLLLVRFSDLFANYFCVFSELKLASEKFVFHPHYLHDVFVWCAVFFDSGHFGCTLVCTRSGALLHTVLCVRFLDFAVCVVYCLSRSAYLFVLGNFY